MTQPAGRTDDGLLVVGGGLIGLSIAEELSARGLRLRLLDAGDAGAASPASAGMLAPSVEGPLPYDAGLPEVERERLRRARAFAEASRDRYAAFLARLQSRGGRPVAHLANGILQVALDDEGAERLRQRGDGGAPWLEQAEVARLEPSLRHVRGALWHERDGAVDNVRLLESLRQVLAAHGSGVETIAGRAIRLERAGAVVAVHLEDGRRLEAERVVLASGAWASRIAGLPQPLPVEPVRGQMLSVAAEALRRVVYGPGGYVLPRGTRTLLGASMERAGFSADTTEAGIAEVRARCEAIVPALRGAPEVARWAGVRPMTPDGLPILGADPEWPALVYACGHSRNGVLLAPATALAIGGLLLDGDAGPVAPFGVDRPALAAARAPGRVRRTPGTDPAPE